MIIFIVGLIKQTSHNKKHEIRNKYHKLLVATLNKGRKITEISYIILAEKRHSNM